MTFNEATLGGKPIYNPPPGVACNVMYSHTGAARYGVGYFVMMRADIAALVSEISVGNPSQIFELKLTSPQGPGLTIQVVIAGYEPLSTTIGAANVLGQQDTDMMRVKVLDQRCLNFTSVSKAYNVMSAPFAWDTDNSRPFFYPQTLNGSDPWTLAEIVGDINLCPATPAGAPTWVPHNLIWDAVQLPQLIDDLMARLYYVVGWDITESYTCDVPGTMNAANTALFNQAMGTVTNAGGYATRNLSRSPSAFDVGIRAYNADSPGNPYDDTGGYVRTFVSNQVVNADTVGITQPLAFGETVAIWTNGDWANESELTAYCADIAPRAYLAMTCEQSQWEFIGLWPFSPDGAIRGVKWTSDGSGAKTVIRLNNDRDFNPISDMARVMETWQNQLLTPLGASNVGMDSGSGSRQTWAIIAGPQLATIEMSSGANATTPTGNATYKYDVFDYLNENQVASDIAPDPDWRPMGILTGPGSLGYYIVKGGVVALLNTNERANLVSCT